MSLLSRILTAFAEALTDPPPKRTLCCNVVMFDVWQHDDKCPATVEAMARMCAWQVANPGRRILDMTANERAATWPLPRRGDSSTKCPQCGYPTGHYGMYTVGEKCSYCDYVEKRYA